MMCSGSPPNWHGVRSWSVGDNHGVGGSEEGRGSALRTLSPRGIYRAVGKRVASDQHHHGFSRRSCYVHSRLGLESQHEPCSLEQSGNQVRCDAEQKGDRVVELVPPS